MKTKITAFAKTAITELVFNKWSLMFLLYATSALIIGREAVKTVEAMDWIPATVNIAHHEAVLIQKQAIESKGVVREITMYTSRSEETDASPCISADGTDICKVSYNVCASNSHKIGQKLLVKGLGECIVKDRMNSRYHNRIDWYAKMDLARALKFGKQKLEVIEL